MASDPAEPRPAEANAARRPRWLPWLGAALLLAAIVVLWSMLPLGAWLEALRGWIVGLGLRGILVFALIYILGAVVLAPEALLTILAGFAYGFWGLPIVLVAATIGAAAAFLIARYLARDRVRAAMARRRNLAALDKAVAEDGWKIVGLLRLSPLVPFNLQNYLFGATGIPFLHFVAATFFGIIPGTALYTYFGVLGGAAGAAGPVKWVFFAIGLAATIGVAVLIARKAKEKLREAGIGEAAG
jgi:uncharacterized membrane protein YdjX (TVP38/TMEM64 family)